MMVKWRIEKKQDDWLVKSPKGTMLLCYTWEQAWCVANFVALWNRVADIDAVIIEAAFKDDRTN